MFILLVTTITNVKIKVILMTIGRGTMFSGYHIISADHDKDIDVQMKIIF